MVNQTEVGLCIRLPLRLRVDTKLWERKFSCLSPLLDGSLDLWGPEKIGLLHSLRRFGHHGSGAIHVVTANLMLGAVATMALLALDRGRASLGTYHCGKDSSQRMCLLLQVLQPFRDFV